MDRFRSQLKQVRPGQSLVEFSIMLPVLLMMLSGLIEFGFMLNSYLDVIDAAREAARYAANNDPTIGLPTDFINPNFWNRAWLDARGSLATASDGRIFWEPTDPSDCTGVNGDIVVSAFAVLGKLDGSPENTVVDRYPLGYGDVGARNCPANGNYPSEITETQVEDKLAGAFIPNSGFVLIEIYYEYEWLLGLPWITPFFPAPKEIKGDAVGNNDGICEAGEACYQVVLYAYTMMPNAYVEPAPIP